MTRIRSLAICIFWAALSASLIYAQDLRGYREFQFGTNLVAVAKQTHMKPSEAKLLHQRPAMIQELWWYPPLGTSSPAMDPVREVVFSFYNGELFRMVINYDQDRTDGFTDEDMVDAISAKYGIAARPVATVVLFSSSQVYNDSQKVIARWEDAQYSFNLFRYFYQPAFGMVAFSKQLDTMAQAAVVEAFRLDKEEASQRETDRQKQQDDEKRAAGQKVRPVNKANFRP
jgi:hypothetical protein